MEQKREIPWVKKESVSIVVAGGVGREPEAIRTIFEELNYRVDILYCGSRKEFMEALGGTIPTADYLILSLHGDEGFDMPEEDPVVPADIAKNANVEGKIVISTGCTTGEKEYGDAFLTAGAGAYIAPENAPGAVEILMFFASFFSERSHLKKQSIEDAFVKAQSYNEETRHFKLFKA